MTDKLKCPFCGAELEEFGGGDFPLLHYCDNTNCNLYHIMGQYTLWQALIDGKKAQDALKVATAFIAVGSLTMEKAGILDNKNVYKEILNEITSIMKDKDNDLGTVD